MLRSSFSQRNPKDFKILIFYPNLHMSALMPQSVGIFTALLKREGYQLDLFDCTYYEDIEILRFFDLNEKIKMVKLNSNSVAVDEIRDVQKAEKLLKKRFQSSGKRR